uniref:Septin-type G domain-containing protein n=1 Tax=Anabas testudineus TaxID=64144 RepID=A0A3Q1JSW6_ANATE
ALSTLPAPAQPCLLPPWTLWTLKTVGEKNLNEINKTILLVGETGSGKSTLINTLMNYTMGVKFEDNIWFEIVEDEKRSQTESQTLDVIVYEIFGFKGQTLPYSLTIIDTPGYGDTRGIEHDERVSQRLFDLFRSNDGVHEINAVGLVMKSSDNRVSDRLSYIFDSAMSLFGKNMEKNIVALITHSDGMTPENVLQALEGAEIKCAKNEKNEPVHFLFNNCLSRERTEKNKPGLKNAWEVTEEGMEQFTNFLETLTAQKLTTTVEVLNLTVRLKACIQNLQERIEFTEMKQKELQEIQEALTKHEQEMNKNENFTVEVDEPYKVKESISGGWWWPLIPFYSGAVCCTVCEENCHYPGCTIAWYPKDCVVMPGGGCTVCTGKCPVSAHVKEKWIYVNKMKKVQKTLEEMKEKYEKNKEESGKKTNLLGNVEKEMRDLTAEKNQLLEESYQHVVSLEQIALNVNSLSTHVHLDLLIEKMKEKGDTEKVQKLGEIQRGQESKKGFVTGLWYKYGKKNKGAEDE